MNHLAKCGCDCLHCPTYKDNIKTIDARRNCSSGWETYLNIKLSPEKLRACDGCSIPDEERDTYYLNCKIRKCALINNLENCAFCTGFPCDELLKAHSIQEINNLEDYIKKTGKTISEKDYNLFIEPYAGLARLKKIRQLLSQKEIKDFKRYSSKEKFTHFDFTGNKKEEQFEIYKLLSTLCIEKNISYARLQTIERKREQFIKILWSAVFYGTLNKTGHYLELDSKTFMSQKIHGMYNTLLEYLNEMKKYGIYCEVIPLIEKGWLTPMGGLRKEGWIFRLTLGGSLKGKNTLNVLKDYISRLDSKYGNKALKIFNQADLSIMLSN